MKKNSPIYVSLLVFFISVIIFIISLYNYNLSKVSNSTKLKEITIEQGSINSVGNTLKKNNLIKNVFIFKIFIYLSGNKNLKAATYKLSENMGTRKIVKILNSNKGNNNSDIKLTFKEGLNIRNIADIIEKKTNNSKEDVFNLLNDKNYIQSLVDKYWFLSSDILDDRIYYPLEGYLYPNTYSFSSTDVKVEDIFSTMLDEMDKKITKYRTKIDENKLSLHQLLTLASIVELEGTTLEDRKKVAAVFYNRLDAKMTLGSDVTTYYGAKVNMAERDLYANEVNACNNYNTRCATFTGLPVGPICNSSIEAIEAVIEPDNNNYYYFVADKNKKVYFSKNNNEHINTIKRLKENNLWYTY